MIFWSIWSYFMDPDMRWDFWDIIIWDIWSLGHPAERDKRRAWEIIRRCLLLLKGTFASLLKALYKSGCSQCNCLVLFKCRRMICIVRLMLWLWLQSCLVVIYSALCRSLDIANQMSGAEEARSSGTGNQVSNSMQLTHRTLKCKIT